MVQMVAEAVLLVVDPSGPDGTPLHVEAQFTMRNQGEATETMDVRFPMENPDGMGDGWGGRPKIEDFAVRVNGQSLRIVVVEEPLGEGWGIFWATFPVTFPPNTDVRLDVSYSLPPTYSPEETPQAQVGYILQTGAGWYGPIGSAVVTLRLPYAASPSNVFLSDPWNPQLVPPPVFVGREVRWEWTQLEPTAEDDLEPVYVWPARWKEILSLEAQTGERPSDVATAIALSQAYRTAGSERHGFGISEPLYRLAKQAILFARVYNPDSPDLRMEEFLTGVWKCESFPCDDAEMLALIDQYEELIASDPLNERLQELAYGIDTLRQSLATPLPEPTVVSTLPTISAEPSPTRLPTLPTATIDIAVPSNQSSPSLSLPGFFLGVIAGAIASIGVRWFFKRRKS